MPDRGYDGDMQRYLVTCVVLFLQGCLIWHDDDRRGRPGDRHHADDTGAPDSGEPGDTDDPADSGADTSDSGASDSGDSGADDGRDTAIDTAADTGSGGDTGPEAAWTLSPECDGAPLTFLDARVDADTVAPGARVVLAVTLHNPTTDDDLAYPGVLFGSSSAEVTTGGSDWLYGLFAGSSNELLAVYEVSADASGAVVLTATTSRLACDPTSDCPPACTLSYPITVAP